MIEYLIGGDIPVLAIIIISFFGIIMALHRGVYNHEPYLPRFTDELYKM